DGSIDWIHGKSPIGWLIELPVPASRLWTLIRKPVSPEHQIALRRIVRSTITMDSRSHMVIA
ncbi:MAG: hypothetical protein ACKV22_07655, partial [Bryobacteraceae bacterium]